MPDQAILAQAAAGLQHPRLASITLDFSKPFTEEDLAIIGVLVSPELKALRATKGVAQAQVFAAGLLPDPQFSAGLDIPTGGAADLVTAYTFGLSWDIASLITRPAEQRIAKAQEQRVYYEVAWQEWLVAHQVRLLARRVAYLKSQKDLAHQAAEIAERLLEITRRNVASGDAKVGELGLHQVAFLDARDRELAFARELEQTREELNRTLGIPPGERVPLAYPKLLTLADLDPNALFAEARRKRLDLIALQAGYAAQEATVYRAVLGQFPHFTLSVNAARDTSNIRSRGPAVAFDIPILNRNRGAIAVAEATRAQLYQEYAARLHQTRADIATLVADLKRIAEEQAPLANGLPELARAERTLRAAVDTGDATLLSYESVHASLLDKQLKLLALEQLRPSNRWPLGAAGWLAHAQLGSGFMPRMDEGGFILDYKAAPGTSLTETDRLLRQVEALIAALPEVDSYSRRTGLSLGGHITEANEGDFFIHLKPSPRRAIDEVMAELRQRVETQVPGLRIETAQLMEDLIGDLTAVPQPIEIKLFGDDSAILRRLAPEVAARIRTVAGVVEVFDGITIAGDALEIRVDRVKAALEGLDAEAVTHQIQEQLAGSVASQIQSGEKLVGVRVWTPTGLHDHLALIEALRVRAPDGHYLPLKRVAAIGIAEGQAQVVRENLKSMVAVTARIEGRDLGSTMREVQAAVNSAPLPDGVYIEYGGLYREQQQSFRDLLMVFLSAVLLVTALLLFVYERFVVVVSILTTTGLSLSGVFLGLWLTGTELNISAMMGMTMVIGIVTEVAIFYFAELDLDSGHDMKQLARVGVFRMRLILMTSIIAILALTPPALRIGAGSAMQSPLAINIIAGLILAVPLVLLVLPAVYLSLQRLRARLLYAYE